MTVGNYTTMIGMLMGSAVFAILHMTEITHPDTTTTKSMIFHGFLGEQRFGKKKMVQKLFRHFVGIFSFTSLSTRLTFTQFIFTQTL